MGTLFNVIDRHRDEAKADAQMAEIRPD